MKERQKLLFASAVILLITVLISVICYFFFRSGWINQAQNHWNHLNRTIEQKLQAEGDLLTLQINNAYAQAALMEDIESFIRSATFDDYLSERLARSLATTDSIRSFPDFLRIYIHRYQSALYKVVFYGENHTHVLIFETGEIRHYFNVPAHDPALASTIRDGFFINRAMYNPSKGYQKIGDISFHFRTENILAGIDRSGLSLSVLRDFDGNALFIKGDNPKNNLLAARVTALNESTGSLRVGLLNHLYFNKQDTDNYYYQIINGIDDYAMMQNNIIIIVALAVVMLILSTSAIVFSAYRMRYIYSEQELRIKQKQAEMRALQNQINPHFLYNTLEAISAQALVNNDKPTADTITALGTLFRDIVNMPSQISLKDEMRILETYLKIMEAKSEGNFCYQILLEPEVEDFQTVKFWMQPLAENFFIHGFDQEHPYNLLIVRGYPQGLAVCVEVINNGKAIPEEQLIILNKEMSQPEESDVSIGLRNVYNRLRHFYGDSFSLTIANNDEGGVIIKMRVEGGGANVQLVDR